MDMKYNALTKTELIIEILTNKLSIEENDFSQFREFCDWSGKFGKLLKGHGKGKVINCYGSLQKTCLFC